MWKLYLYVCTNCMVCKRQHALQFGTEIVWSIRKTASASGGLRSRTPYRGFVPGPNVPQTPCMCHLHVPLILNCTHPTRSPVWRDHRVASSLYPVTVFVTSSLWRVHCLVKKWTRHMWRVLCVTSSLWRVYCLVKSELVTWDEFSVWRVHCKPPDQTPADATRTWIRISCVMCCACCPSFQLSLVPNYTIYWQTHMSSVSDLNWNGWQFNHVARELQVWLDVLTITHMRMI